jgi:hypothetical protein
LHAKDFAFIDSKDKTNDDSCGHTGKFKGQRQNSSWTFSNFKFLCQFIETRPAEEVMDVNDRSYTNMQLIYEKVESMLYPPGKNGIQYTQNKWKTVVWKLHGKE